MSEQLEHQSSKKSRASAGGSLRRQVEEVGTELAESYTALIGSLAERPSGPQALSDLLGVTVVTASRLLRAIAQSDPVAVVDQIPGVVPLRKVTEAAVAQGVPAARRKAAAKAVDRFEELIRKNAGHRSSLNAMLTDWLPQGRREFEVRRRQAAYKAISELRGVSCELDLATIVVHPSSQAGLADLLSIQGSFGLDRIRPDATVQFGTLRTPAEGTEDTPVFDPAPAPRTLDDQPLEDGLHSVRLDQFCSRAPAPIIAKQFGRHIQYLLGDTGFGPESSVDLVIAEVNRAELIYDTQEKVGPSPYFFQIPATPSRAMLFDVLIHRDIYTAHRAELMVYDTTTRGPAQAGSEERAVDLLRTTDELEHLGTSPARRRFPGFPRYTELLEHALGKLAWNREDFVGYRVQISYPLHGTQVCVAFPLKE